MWLLSTDRAELKYFPTVQAAHIASFAILSHVWDESEQSFQETQALREQCVHTTSSPRDLSTAKVRESCALAEQHGYSWIWNDACCIDKTSSSELSEAINSMFSYYAHADVCYAYLKDVSPDCQVTDYRSSFRFSRWFQRGWTLQELLAPELVIFLSSAWTILGTKASRASVVAEITRIPQSVLLLEEEISATSVAERMSWASNRKTTRPEDEAYCLLGIFDINMPPLYGEGTRAFQRLQEEIMKNSVDTTLYAWCIPLYSSDVTNRRLLAASPQDFSLSKGLVFSPKTLYTLYDFVSSQRRKHQWYKFQKSMPTGTRPLDPLPWQYTATAYPSQLSGIPAFDITPYGIRARLPIVTTKYQRDVAILFVSPSGSDSHSLSCLELEKCDPAAAADPTRPLYYVLDRPRPGHEMPLWKFEESEDLSQWDAAGRDRWDQFLSAPWRTVYFLHDPAPQSLSAGVRIATNRDITTSFRIPPSRISELAMRHPELRFVGNTTSLTPQAELTLTLKYRKFPIRLHLGRCAAPESPPSAVPGGHHWAVLEWPRPGDGDAVNRDLAIVHVCSTDHIDDWPRRTRSWTLPHVFNRDPQLTLTLSFAPSQIDPAQYRMTVFDAKFDGWDRC